MTYDQNHTANLIHEPHTDEERERYHREWTAWCRSIKGDRCPGCADNGVQVTLGRREPEATRCPVCQGAPHPADGPHAHLGTIEGERWHESNWRCERCGGAGEVSGHYTSERFEPSHAELCRSCDGLGIHVMPADGLQLYAQHDAEALVGACEAAIRELEAVQRCDGHAPSTENVLHRLRDALKAR